MKPETKEIRFRIPVALHDSFKALSAARGFTLAGMLRAYVRQVTLHALSASMKHPPTEDATPVASQGKAGAKYWCRVCEEHVTTSVNDDETCSKCGGYVVR